MSNAKTMIFLGEKYEDNKNQAFSPSPFFREANNIDFFTRLLVVLYYGDH